MKQWWGIFPIEIAVKIGLRYFHERNYLLVNTIIMLCKSNDGMTRKLPVLDFFGKAWIFEQCLYSCGTMFTNI